MINNSPKVCITIPLYNAEKHINDTIQSVLDQTYKNFKLIIIDDKSTDKSIEKIKSFHDSRITIISNSSRLGFFENWNTCLRYMDCEYGKLLPHDDILDPYCLERQVLILDKFPSLSYVHCQRNIIDPNGKILTKRKSKEKYGIKNIKDSIKTIVRSGTNPIGEPGAVLFRSSLQKKAGNFSENDMFTIDIDYWSRLLEFGDRYSQNEILCSFRVWPGSASVKLYKNQTKSIQHFHNRLKKKYPAYIHKNDLIIGYFRSYINKYLRGIFYYWISKKIH